MPPVPGICMQARVFMARSNTNSRREICDGGVGRDGVEVHVDIEAQIHQVLHSGNVPDQDMQKSLSGKQRWDWVLPPGQQSHPQAVLLQQEDLAGVCMRPYMS